MSRSPAHFPTAGQCQVQVQGAGQEAALHAVGQVTCFSRACACCLWFCLFPWAERAALISTLTSGNRVTFGLPSAWQLWCIFWDVSPASLQSRSRRGKRDYVVPVWLRCLPSPVQLFPLPTAKRQMSG